MKRHNITALRHEIRRQRRNNVLLLLIVSLYAISWLPFNISYILVTYTNRFHTSDDVHSFPDQKSNELSKYLPLRFLICMISAMTNPFLYSYFNETFKDGLQKFFSLCCPRMNREIKQVSFNQTLCSTNKINLNKNNLNNRQSNLMHNQSLKIFNGNLKHSSSNSRLRDDSSARLVILSSTNFPKSILSSM
ncbi:unnamed protein product [Rotaria sp. Silwood2]|nr:unnamed protein product [Rotaria sp. Silwood2]